MTKSYSSRKRLYQSLIPLEGRGFFFFFSFQPPVALLFNLGREKCLRNNCITTQGHRPTEILLQNYKMLPFSYTFPPLKIRLQCNGGLEMIEL